MIEKVPWNSEAEYLTAQPTSRHSDRLSGCDCHGVLLLPATLSARLAGTWQTGTDCEEVDRMAREASQARRGRMGQSVLARTSTLSNISSSMRGFPL